MATKKTLHKKAAKAKTPDKPIPKYHVDHKTWDKHAVMLAVCDQLISTSKGLAYICRDNSELPNIATVFRWLADEDQGGGEKPLCDMYARAKDMQMDYLADETIEIGDNEASTPLLIDGIPLLINEKPVLVTDSASVQHAKLRCDNRRWVASKLKHRKYGDKLQLAEDPERPLSGVASSELEAMILALMKKMRTDES